MPSSFPVIDRDSQALIKAPAKVNIRLKVTGRRPDGYHELVSLMVPVGLFDEMELARTKEKGITLTCRGDAVPRDETNLSYKAAQVFFERTGLPPGISINLKKHIPVAAGLGGGSSDAAGTLEALNALWDEPLTREELRRLARGLGADVPFFLQPGPCIARGIGEILEPVHRWPCLYYVIVTPDLHVSTSWVYGRLKLKLTRNEYDFIVKSLRKEPLEITPLLENDLETVTASRFPIVGRIKKSLMDTGAEGSLMSGSGPSVFGVFRSEARARRAEDFLASRHLGRTFVAAGLGPKDWGVVKW